MKNKGFPFARKRKRNYFEGWYVRIHNEKRNLAAIFALTYDQTDPHAFLHFFDGEAGWVKYRRFPLEAFKAGADYVRIGPNILTPFSLAIEDSALSARVAFSARTDPGKSAMGPLHYLPLQCYQDVLMLDATATGTVDARPFEGAAYLEKTYGRAFPRRWFWLQANAFPEGAALSTAGGTMPFLSYEPFGFFALFTHNGRHYRFSTYNRARFSSGEGWMECSRGGLSLALSLQSGRRVTLRGPAAGGKMNRDVEESLEAVVQAVLKKDGRVLYRGASPRGGLEWML